MPHYYVAVHNNDDSEYFINIRAIKSVELSIRDEGEEAVTMKVSFDDEEEGMTITGDDLLTVLVKMDRFSDIIVEQIVEDRYFDGPKDLRDDFYFRMLYKKFKVDKGERF